MKFETVVQLPGARRLLAADAISKAGDWVLFVAMSALVFDAGGVGALALFSLARILVPAVLGPWAGGWGMALVPRTLMIRVDVARAALLVLAVAAAGTHRPVWMLEALVVGCAVLTAFHAPAERRFQRDVIEADRRPDFNAVIGATATTVMVVAPALEALMATTIGNLGALAVDAASFVVSAFIVSGIRPAAPAAAHEPLQKQKQKQKQPGPTAERRTGTITTVVRVLKNQPVVAACLITQATACTIAGGSMVLLPPLGSRLHAGNGAIGWLTTAIGVGSVLGVLAGGSIARQGRLLLCVGSIVTMGIALGALGSSPNLLLALGCAVLVGAAANLPEPTYWTSYAGQIKESDSGPVYGLVESAITGGFALGGTLLGAATAAVGTSRAAWTVGIAAGLVAATAFAPALRSRRTNGTAAPSAPAAERVQAPA
ncbi:MFS transporter [Kitasatospora sp. MBT63]|uniref:MFS transporter n=1 Tax=Kitasatospora sp. MBT63 TaxID=1444768 RepID=UPI00053AF0E4|nr:MFS transporter [Kitasatospora sp. MBT63]